MNQLISGVSAVVPVFNGAKYITASVDSLLKQTTPLSEIILVNDASTDHTYEITEDLARKNQNVKVFHFDVNAGVSVARNFGVQNANSDWILFMDDDDLAEDNLLERYIHWIRCLGVKDRDKYPVIYPAYQIMDDEGNVGPDILYGQLLEPDEALGYMIVRNTIISSSGVVIPPKNNRVDKWNFVF